MITREIIEQFYLDVDALNLKFPNAELKKATGYSSGNVSDILKKKREPSEDFLKAFYKKFPKSSQNVPAGNGATGNTPLSSGSDISTLIQNNAALVRSLEKAQENNTKALDTLAKCQEDQRELIALLKANSNPVAKEISEGAVNETVVEWILKVGVDAGTFPTVEAGRKELGKTLIANVEKRKKAGIAAS